MARPPSLLSDALLRSLMAAGQTDVVIGVPTLNNAATIAPVMAAVHDALGGGLHRALILNSDGGSDDGTPEYIAQAATQATSTVLASHSLRTMHRIMAPFHRVPGRRAAIRTLFAAADLLQARALLVVDPACIDPSVEVVRCSLSQILDAQADFVGASARSDARDRPLVSQVIRPFIETAFGRCFDDPTGEEFAVSSRFVSHALAAPTWDAEPLRAGVDIWLRVHALAGPFATVQLSTPPRARSTALVAPPLRDVVNQVLTAVWTCLDLHASAWTAAPGPMAVPTIAVAGDAPAVPEWHVESLGAAFVGAAAELTPIWCHILPPHTLDDVVAGAASMPPRLGDDVWADVLVAFATAWKTRHVRIDDLATSFVPLYQGRAATVLGSTAALSADEARERVESGSRRLLDRRNRLAAAWTSRPQEEA